MLSILQNNVKDRPTAEFQVLSVRDAVGGFPSIDNKFLDRIAYYNAFDKYYVKHNLEYQKNIS